MTEAVHTVAIASSEAAGRLHFYLLRYQYLFLCLVLMAVLFDLMIVARHSPLGTDDLMARISAQSPSLWTMLTLLREQPVNVDAPVFPVLAYCAAHLPLPVDIAIRAPSMIALCIALTAVFLLVRARLNVGAAYLAIAFLALSPYALYGAIARPYALLLASVSAALLCWCRATEGGQQRRFWLTGLAISSTAALLTQYFAPFVLLPIGAGELLRSWLRRKMDWPIWAALAVGVLLFAPVYLTFAPGGKPYGAHPFTPLNVIELKKSYAATVNFDAAVSLIISISLLATPFRRARSLRSFASYEWLAMIGIAASPWLIFNVGGSIANTYSCRHGICAALGIALLLAACTNQIAKGSTAVLVFFFALAFVITQWHFAHVARQPVYRPTSPWAGATPELLQRYPDLPLVTPDFDYAMRTQFYAPSWLSSRLVMITSRESMIRYNRTDNPALAALAVHRWTGWPLVDYYAFVREHRQFLLYGQYWIWDALKADGAKVQYLGNIGPYRLHLVNLPPI